MGKSTGVRCSPCGESGGLDRGLHAGRREYDLQYRGEPRLDVNDIAFLENKYVPDLLLRVYEHTLKFNGAFSGTIKARRDMGNVAAAKNRLAGR